MYICIVMLILIYILKNNQIQNLHLTYFCKYLYNFYIF